MSEWDDAVLSILKNPDAKGIIVDVRNNPGGYLQSAVDLGSEFLEEGKVVVAEQYGDGTKDEFYVTRVGRLLRDKVVVMINGGSASASEILAGALRDEKQAQLVGTTSFGKGTVQEAKSLDNESGIHITVAKWLTPNGTWVHEKGLTPDVEVKDDPATPEDEQLDAAVALFSKQDLSFSSGK
jgi:carboxyl-terminal processing protease